MKEFKLQDLNRAQLDALGKLSFDLAKGALGLSIIPPFITSENMFIMIVKIIMGLFWGVAFTYIGLLLLKGKKEL